MSLILSGTDGLSDVDGTAATPAIRGTDANTGIFFPAADTIAFAEGGAEVARFDSAGNFGLGTASPSQAIDVQKSQGWITTTSTTGTLSSMFKSSNTGGSSYFGRDNSVGGVLGSAAYATVVYGSGAYPMTFHTNDTERMRLDSSGNLGIGTTSPAARLEVSKSENGETGAIIRNATNGTNAGALLKFIAGTDFGQIIRFPASHGAKANELYITNVGTTSPITFATQDTERMRLDSSGNLLVGTTTASAKITVIAANGTTSMLGVSNTTSGNAYGISSSLQTAANNTSSFHFTGSTLAVGNWYLYGNGTSSWSSDERLKHNIQTTRDGYIEDVCKLRVVKYQWKNGPQQVELGLIAQEVEQIFPGLVQDDLNPISPDDPILYKQLKGSVLPMILLKAIQEQQTLITQLTARITALETPAVTPPTGTQA